MRKYLILGSLGARSLHLVQGAVDYKMFLFKFSRFTQISRKCGVKYGQLNTIQQRACSLAAEQPKKQTVKVLTKVKLEENLEADLESNKLKVNKLL